MKVNLRELRESLRWEQKKAPSQLPPPLREAAKAYVLRPKNLNPKEELLFDKIYKAIQAEHGTAELAYSYEELSGRTWGLSFLEAGIPESFRSKSWIHAPALSELLSDADKKKNLWHQIQALRP